jgi:hypothetical protein
MRAGSEPQIGRQSGVLARREPGGRARRLGYRALPVALPSTIERPCRGRRPSARPLLAAAAILAALLAIGISACGNEGGRTPIEIKGGEHHGVRPVLGFPVIATKNTTRIAGKDPVEDAAAVVAAVYPGRDGGKRPIAVALVDKGNWRAGVAAGALVAPPLRAPILLTDGGEIPGPTRDALRGSPPTGTALANGLQALSIGSAGLPDGLSTKRIAGGDPFTLAAAIDGFRSRLTGRPSGRVLVVSATEPAFAMPAAAWAAKSGDAVLFVTADTLPSVTRKAIAAHSKPDIYVLGPPSIVGDRVVKELGKLGRTTRIGGARPVENAVAFARYSDGPFGWGIRDPGHGLVIANVKRPLDAAAAAALSSSGTYGPLLLTDSADNLPRNLGDFLLDIQPGYRNDPVRGVYNHAWLMGDENAIGGALQAKIDELTEIVRVKQPSQ